MTRASLASRLALVAAAPFVVAGKCVPYHPGFDSPGGSDGSGGAGGGEASTSASAASSASGGRGGDGGEPPGVVPAEPCAQIDEAHLVATNKAYAIQCGCAESEGKTCTVAVGATVVWTFGDSEAHNVSATFGESPDKLTGTFQHTFPEPGVYPYECTLHGTITGYAIVVVP